MKVFSGNRIIDVPVREVSWWGRFFGLMFRSKKTENLLFDFGRETGVSLHSFFVFFDFLVIWLDEKNRVLDSQVVRPFRFSVNCGKRFVKIVEIPLNQENRKISDFFVKSKKV